MKTILLAFLCFALFLVACNSESKTVTADTPAADHATSSLAQKNLAAVHVVNKAFETGDVSGIDSILAPNFVDHTDRGDMNGDSLKAMIKMSYGKDKTQKSETIKELADDEYVFALMHYTGTGDGVMMPAGPYDMHSVEVVKFNNDGKATEHWAYMEMTEVVKMMAKMQDGGKKK